MNKQLVVLVALFIYVFILSVFIEPNSLNITKYALENNRLDGIRIAFLTDFHFKKHDYDRLNKIIKETNKLNADLILLGGDFVNGKDENNSMNPDIIAQKLSLLNAPTYSVLGENDWWIGGNRIASALNQNRIRVLENSSIRAIIKRRYVDIIGLADYTTRTVNVSRALYRTGQPRIVITHHPDTYYDIIENVDLILAGHTHGGQFVLPFTRPIFVSSKFGADFASGLIKKSANNMIISKGLGTSVIPARLNCKPEIVVVDFVRVGQLRYMKNKRK